MHLEVVGTNRVEIHRLGELTRRAVCAMGLSCEIKEVTQPEEVAQHSPLTGPSIFIDGVLVSSSRSVRPEDIQAMIRWRHPEAFAKS